MSFTVMAPAKINWFLSVREKRDDGYHEIVSPMQCVSLSDTLTFSESDSVELSSEMDLPVDRNLVYRTALLLKDRFGVGQGARITLKKDIPAAAGLGGGSSDAAATLNGLNRLWRLGLSMEELLLIGAEIGSDVPFFIDGPFALAEGRGERVSPLRAEDSVTLLLVKPAISVSTAWAYGALEPGLTKKSVDIKLFCLSLARKDFVSLRRMVFNDLENAVMREYPVVAGIKSRLLEQGAVISSMSGSGPTVFGVFTSAEEARKASAHMGEHWCRIVRTLTDRESR